MIVSTFRTAQSLTHSLIHSFTHSLTRTSFTSTLSLAQTPTQVTAAEFPELFYTGDEINAFMDEAEDIEDFCREVASLVVADVLENWVW